VSTRGAEQPQSVQVSRMSLLKKPTFHREEAKAAKGIQISGEENVDAKLDT